MHVVLFCLGLKKRLWDHQNSSSREAITLESVIHYFVFMAFKVVMPSSVKAVIVFSQAAGVGKVAERKVYTHVGILDSRGVPCSHVQDSGEITGHLYGILDREGFLGHGDRIPEVLIGHRYGAIEGFSGHVYGTPEKLAIICSVLLIGSRRDWNPESWRDLPKVSDWIAVPSTGCSSISLKL